MIRIPKVITEVVQNDLCIGCGLCVYKCPEKALTMNWNEYGFLIPEHTGNCDTKGECIEVCPFNPKPPKEVETENELAQLFLGGASNLNEKTGRYNKFYAGYSKEFRLTSSSGGVTSYILTQLLEKRIVDCIFSIKESETPGVYYEYAISFTRDELLKASKTRYFPVTLGNVLPKISEIQGKVAIVGVACFIKAIRLAQYKNPALKEKIPFLAGIICGGLKSRFYTEYLSEKAGAGKQFTNPQYRIKNFDSTAGDYSFGCYDVETRQKKTIRMKTAGDMWGTGLFKAHACDFCEDVTTELADISMGDAWINPYHQDGRGTNLVVTRSELAENLVSEGIAKGELVLEEMDSDRFILSQKGAYNHKHNGLPFRIKRTQAQNMLTPVKRFGNKKVPPDFKVVQFLRMKIRKKSLEEWRKNPKAEIFDRKMNKYLILLKLATAVYHYKKLIMRKFSKMLK